MPPVYRDFRVVEWSIRQHPFPGDPAHGIPAGDGYIIDLELSPINAGSVTCATAIAGAESADDSSTGAGPATVSLTPTNDGTIFAFLMASNHNTPSSTGMTDPITGFTTILGADHSRSTITIGYQACDSGVLYTASGTWTPGYEAPTKLTWGALLLALPSSVGTIVQTKYVSPSHFGTLDTPPTPGNTVLVFAIQDSTLTGGTIGPNDDPDLGPTDWTTLVTVDHPPEPGQQEYSIAHMGVFAHCVTAEDTGQYAYGEIFGFSTGRAILIVEMDLS